MKRYLTALMFPVILAGCAGSSDQDGTALPATTDNATLTRYYWQLQDAKNGKGELITALFVQPDKPVQLEFDNGNFSVSNICNNMGGSYSLYENQLTFGAMASTKKMCAESAVAALDDEVGSRLRGSNLYSILSAEQPVLTLTAANGDVLRFIGIPTPATRYGSEGEIIFIEVAPQTVPCSQSAAATGQCLQVRQVYYDDNGLKTGTPSPWQDFSREIEGYRFQPGIRNILRVKRYRIAEPAANAADTAYVLDMVVESEIMPPRKPAGKRR